MSNIVTDFGHGIKVGAEDAAKGVKAAAKAVIDAPAFLAKAEQVIATAIKDQPELKSAVLDLIKQGTTVIGEGATAASEKGIDLQQDAKTLADAEAFFTYFLKTFVPLVEAVYKEVVTDVK